MSEETTHTVLIVEDHAFTRDGLRVAISRDSELRVIGEARSGEEALELLAQLKPNVLVMDIGLPGIDGIETTRQAKVMDPKVRVVILTVHDLEREVLAALHAGAEAYCLKSTDPSGLRLAIHTAAMGGTYLDPLIARVLRRLSPLEPKPILSPRELEVLQLIAEGKNNKEIALELGISLSTVKTHVEDLLAKLAASDRTQAAVTALRRGLL